MKTILSFIILLFLSTAGLTQNVISNNWNVRLNTFKFAVSIGSGTPSATDTILTVYNNGTTKLWGTFILNGTKRAAAPSYILAKQNDSTISELSIANEAANAILPSQSGQASSILSTDGTNVSWISSPLVFSDTSTTTVANTTSTLTLLGTGLGGANITGITGGSVITMKGAGNLSTDATAGVPTINVTLANQTVGLNLTGLANSLVNSPYDFEARFIVPTLGSGKRLLYSITINVDNNGSPKTYRYADQLPSLNISSSSTYDISAGWNTASSNNSIVSLFNTVEINRK